MNPGITETKVLKFSFTLNKKDMKPFHIDRELERPILFENVLSYSGMAEAGGPCGRTPTQILAE